MSIEGSTIPLTPKAINLTMYDKIYTKKSYNRGMDNYTMECPIHGEFTIQASYNTPKQPFTICPNCDSFCGYLDDTYGKEASFMVMKDIYRFSWDNLIIVDRIKKAITDPEARCHRIYKIIKEKVKGYKEPQLLSEMVVDLDNINEDDIVFNVDTIEDGKLAVEPAVVNDPPSALEVFKSKLSEITLGAVEFVELENKPPKALTQLVAICPIHDSVYTTSLADMHAHKIQCEHCLPYYNKLVEKYKEKESFKLMMGIYAEYVKYKNDYPNVALSLKTLNMLKEVKPDYHRFAAKTKAEREGKIQHLGTLNVKESNSTNMGNMHFTDKNWNELPQPTKTSPKKGKAAGLIEFFNNLTAADIKSIRIEIDLETDNEVTVIAFKSGRMITIIG